MAEVRKIPILHILKFFIQHCVCQFCYIVTRAADILEAPNDEAAVEFGLRRQASVIHTQLIEKIREEEQKKREEGFRSPNIALLHAVVCLPMMIMMALIE
jgi:hypothetical protein